jgi:predicted DNA-binding transcriptional regulator AlpA
MGAKDACGMTAVGRSDPPRLHAPQGPMTRQVVNAALILPRLLRRADAAVYLGVSTTFFDRLVRDGSLPGPKRLAEGVRAWDRFDLDAVVDALESDSAAPAPDTSWDD